MEFLIRAVVTRAKQLAGLYLLLLACVTASATASDGKTIQLRPERLVSENTFVYVSTPDFRRARSAFERTAFKSLFSEDDVWQPLKAALGKLRDVYVKGDGTRAEADVKHRNEELDLLFKLAPLLDGGMALAIDAPVAAPNGNKKSRFMFLSSLAAGDTGLERHVQLQDALDQYRSILIQDGRYKDHDDLKGSYTIQSVENADLELYEEWAFVENLFVYAQGRGMIEEALERYVDKNSAGCLALSAGYQNAYKEAGRDDTGESLVYIQVDAKPLLAGMDLTGKPILKAIYAATQQDIGRPQLAMGVQVGAGLENAPIREKLMVRAGKELSMEAGEPCKAYTARFATGDTLFYYSTQSALADLIRWNRETLNTVIPGLEARVLEKANPAPPPTPGQPVPPPPAPGAPEKKDDGPKVTLEDLLKNLGVFKGEMSVILNYVPKTGGRLDDWRDVLNNFQIVYVTEIDKAGDKDFRAVMDKVEAATGQFYNETIHAPATLRYQKGLVPGEDKFGPGPLGLYNNLPLPEIKCVPFFNAYAVFDFETETGPKRYALFSDSLEALKKSISQAAISAARTGRSSLGNDPRFKDAFKNFKDNRQDAVYFDLVGAADIYGNWTPQISRSAAFTQETLSLLPSSSILKKHLFPMAMARSVNPGAEGWLYEFSSPTGNLPMTGLIGSLAWPAYNAQRQKSISDESMERFRKLMLGLNLYAADFDRLPQQISDLVPNYVKDLKTFESPFFRNAVKSSADTDATENTNLVYIPGRSLLSFGKEILLYEKEPTCLVPNAEGKLFHYALLLDGTVTHVPAATLQKMLQGTVAAKEKTIKDNKTSNKNAGNLPVPPKRRF